MKKLLLLILSLLLPLVACSSPATGVALPSAESTSAQSVMRTFTVSALPSPAMTDAAMPTASPSPSETAADIQLVSPTPSPSEFIPDTDLPDDIVLPDDMLASWSNYFESCLREDKYNIYYAHNNTESDDDKMKLFCVNKKTGSKKAISKGIYSFALCGGKVYYTPSNKSGRTINSYDPVTGKTKQIKKFKNSVYDMASYKGKLYFTYETVYHEDYDIPLTDLYVMKPDGSGRKKIQDNVAEFCIYKDIIYYYESSWPDDPPIDRCKLDGSGQKNILEWADSFTAICNNKIYYYDGSNEICIDIDSGKTQLPSFLNDTGDYYACCAPLGKYILSLSQGLQNPPNITAFDTASNKTYNLMELEKDYCYDMYTSPYGAYISFSSGGGSFDLYRLVIENGKASMDLVVSYTTPPSENPAPTNTAGPVPTPVLTPTAMPLPYPSVY